VTLCTAASLGVLALAAAPHPARAHLERSAPAARAAGLGDAFVSVADDATAVVANPAGLVNLPAFSALATWQSPYGLDDLAEGFFAAAARTRHLQLGVAWFHRGLDGALSEDLVTVAVARDLLRTAEDASLSVGASVDLARVSVNADGLDASDGAATLGLAIHMRPFPVVGVGYAVRHLNAPTLHLVGGGPGTPLERTHTWGISYYWERRLVVSFESALEQGQWHNRAGVEVILDRRLFIRSGMDGRYASAGIGARWSGIALDVSVRSHETLGASTLFTIGYAPEPPADPYAQTP
jgi:hypothetical protein